MSYCWYCAVNAWPAEIAIAYFETYRRFPDVHPVHIAQALHWGPGHVVWEDENFDDACVLRVARESKKHRTIEHRIVHVSLTLLLCIPEAVRDPYPDPGMPVPPPKGPMFPMPHPSNYPADIKERYDAPYEPTH